MQTGNTDSIYKNEHYMAYAKSKDLVKRTLSDKVLRDKAFKLQVIQNKMVIKGG